MRLSATRPEPRAASTGENEGVSMRTFHPSSLRWLRAFGQFGLQRKHRLGECEESADRDDFATDEQGDDLGREITMLNPADFGGGPILSTR